MTCTRGHSQYHQITTFVVQNGKVKKVKTCDYVMGVVGVESKGHKAILCGDYPRDEDLPKTMLRMTQ